MEKEYKIKSTKMISPNSDILARILEDNIGELEVPSTIKKIGIYNPLRYKNSLTKIIVPDTVELIGSDAFYSSGLEEAIINCNRVNTYGFEGTPLKKLILGDNVKELADYCCRERRYLEYLDLGNGVQRLGVWCFRKCEALKTLVIPDSVTYLGNGAFEGCTGLESVIIGSGITSTGFGIFEDCNITEITYRGTVESGNKIFNFNFLSGSKIKRIICSDGTIELEG